jgi:hypothetical protein
MLASIDYNFLDYQQFSFCHCERSEAAFLRCRNLLHGSDEIASAENASQ